MLIKTGYTFEEVKVKATKKYIDADGKKRSKTETFSQTINPFNKGTDGLPKTREQILKEITAARNAWLAKDGI